jgi:hypothetical protein
MSARRFVTWMVLPTLLSALAIIGCGPGPGSGAPHRGVLEEYIDPAGPRGANVLLLYENGAFELRHCPRHLSDSEAPSEFVAEGEWARSEGVLVLTTDDWEAMFVSAIVPLSLNRRADTLRGLQWMQSSSETPVDTCRFVRRSEFAEFIYPMEGSGTRQAGW